MKSLYTNLNLKKLIAPLAFIFFFFALISNVNSQSSPTLDLNSITPPAYIQGCGSVIPGTISGTTVSITNIVHPITDVYTQVDACYDVFYQWQSSPTGISYPSPESFTDILGATSKDFDPVTVTTTTYYRRVAGGYCDLPSYCNAYTVSSKVKITVYNNPNLYTVSVTGSTPVCPGASSSIGLSGSQTSPTVLYTLYKDNVLVSGSTQTGTGSALSWSVSDPSCNASPVYTVKGQVQQAPLNCEEFMTGSATITFIDATGPTWSTSSNALNTSVECSEPSGLSAAQALAPTAVDGCGGTISYTKTSGSFVTSCGATGSYTNTWVAKDPCLNTSTVFTQVITVTDLTAPTWSTTATALNTSVECSNSEGLASAQALAPLATDNCGGTISYTKTAGSFVQSGCSVSTGTITNTWVAKDPCGNTSLTFTQTITITDATGPTWSTTSTALNRSAECSDASGLVAAQALAPTAIDNCPGTVSYTKTSGLFVAGSCGLTGSYTNTWVAKDPCLNTSTIFTQVITITDATAPTWSTTATFLNRSVECSDASGLSAAQALAPTATDNCGGTISYTKTSGLFVTSCGATGSYTNTWIAKDPCLNSSTVFTQVITVTDLTAPTWSTTATALDRSVGCSDESGLATAQALAPTAIDNCGGTISYTKTSGSFVQSGCSVSTGTITNTWVAKDPCLNTSTVFTQLITITDLTAPTWSTTATTLDRSVECSNTEGLAIAQALAPTAIDNCGGTISYTKTSGSFVTSCGATGIYTNTWIAKDPCGNTSLTFTQTITVTDLTAPTWSTTSTALNTSVECSDGPGLAAAQALAPIATDNCGGTISYTKTSGSFVQSGCSVSTGTITNTWIAKDPCLNTSTVFTQVITIFDHTAPTWTTIAGTLSATVECSDGSGLAAANLLAPLATDNCGGTISYTKTTGSFVQSGCSAATGSYTNTWVAKDPCLNTSTVFTQVITIIDVTPPTWTTIAGALNTSVECSDGSGLTAAQALRPVATDNCNGVSYFGAGSGPSYAPGLNVTITKTAGSFIAGSCGATGTYVNTFLAHDVCSNTSTVFTQTITITDVTPPSITCPAPLTIGTNDTYPSYSCTYTGPIGTVTATDLCTATASITITNNAPTLFPLGVTTVTWTATDLCGNASTCTQIITVVDDDPPAITCVGNQIKCATTTDTQTYTAQGTEFDPTIVDNCSALAVGTYTLTGATTGYGSTTLDGVAFNTGTTTVIWTATDAGENTASCTFTVTVNAKPIIVLTGVFDVCCDNSGGGPGPTYCDYNYVPNDGFSYQWTVSGGVMQYGSNSSCIGVVWNCNCTQGWVELIKTNLTTGCVTVERKWVTIHPKPIPVISGNLTPSTTATKNYSIAYTSTTPAHLYTWVVVGGSVTAGQGTCSVTISWDWAACQDCPSSICVFETNEYGCIGEACVTITQIGPANISGTVYYDKYTYGVSTPIPVNGVNLQLLQGSTVVATTTSYEHISETGTGTSTIATSEPGYYVFPGVLTGTYTIRVASVNNKVWGGSNNVTATDALLIKLSIGTPSLIGALQYSAANVNNASGVNATDALLVQLRIVARVNSFAAGDWVSDAAGFTLTTTLTAHDINILQTGDVNRSYPINTGYKAVEYTSLQKDGISLVNNSQEFELPIRVNDVLSLGAVTLDLAYNQNLIDVRGVTSPLSGFDYNIINGKVKLAWSNTIATNLQANDVLLTLKVKAKEAINAATDLFSFGNNTEFADETGKVLDFSTLKTNSIATDASAYGISVYPNPFKNNAEIDYNLVEAGSVKLAIYNAIGQRIEVLVDEFKTAGNYTFNLNTTNLESGVYNCEIIINGKTSNFQKVIKLVKTK